MEKKPLVFISHVHEDSEIANVIKDWLEKTLLGALHFFVSSDEISIPAGKVWLQEITSALSEASITLLVISPLSIERRWIDFEAGAACSRKIPVIPICVNGMRVSGLPSPLSFFEAIELANKKSARKLVRMMAELAGLACPSNIALPRLPTVRPIRQAIAPLIKPRSEIPRIEDQLCDAKEIWVLAVTGKEFAKPSLRRACSEQGQCIKVLLLDPDGEAIVVWAQQFETEKRIIADEIEGSIGFFKQLPNIQIRFMKHFVPFSMLAANPDEENGSIVVAFHTYKQDSEDRPFTYLRNYTNSPWYARYRTQFQEMWQDAISKDLTQ